MVSFKKVLLLASACGKRVGDLHALSTDAACMEFGTDDCMVRLQPRRGYVPKGFPTSFRAQIMTLQGFASQDSASTSQPRRSVRALERSIHCSLSEQLFVCFIGCTKGLPISKQRLSHWIVDAIALAYASMHETCPFGVCAHSTSSVAWARGISIQDICLAAGWYSQDSFARFYNLEITYFALLVLSVQ